MTRAIRVLFQVVVMLLLASPPATAWEHHHGWHYYYRPRVVVGVGPWWGPPYAPWGYYPAPYAVYAPPVVVAPQMAYPPPVVVAPQPQPQPPVYVERPDAPPAEAEEQAAPGSQEVGASWYYCPSARAYYPKVERCPEQWVRVPPSGE